MAYQSIFFERRKGPDKGFFFIRDDQHGWKKFKYQPPVYNLDPEGEYDTLFGQKCSRIKGQYDYFDNNILEKDVLKEIAALRDLYYKDDAIPTFHNILFLDIEIQIMGALTPQHIAAAPAEITSLALIDKNTGQKICFIVDCAKKLRNMVYDGKEIVTCKNEKDLINKFIDKWVELDPTIVVGWNSAYFDIPYLYYRIKRLMGESTVLKLSPIRKIIENPKNPDNPIQIGGINCLDYMLLTKKYITKEEPSYKLHDIGIKYADLGKIEYEGNLDQLFEKDPEQYIDYNIRDVEIIVKLEENMQFLNLTILISHLCHTPYESIFYNTVLNEGAILTYLKRKGVVAHNKPTTINPTIRELSVGDIIQHQRGTPTIEGEIIRIDDQDETLEIKTKSNDIRFRDFKSVRKKDSYAGGYLLDPKPGIYRWLSDYDYASLYPSIIRSLNLGIETLIGRIIIDRPNYNIWWGLEDLKEKDPNLEIEIEMLDKASYTFKTRKSTVGKLIQIIEANKYTISANGVMFRTDIQSIAAAILSDWFRLRQEYKGLMKQAEKAGDKAKARLYDSQQHSLKILLNAVYGAFAINSWRFTDGYKILSSAITCTGQRLIQETIKYANEVIDERYMKDDLES